MSKHHRYALGTALLVAACGGDEIASGPGAAFILPADGSAPLIATIPFPSDLYVDDAGELQITAELLPFKPGSDQEVVEAFASAFREQDCFGLTGGVSFPLSEMNDARVDATTLGDATHIVDLATGDEIPAEVNYRHQEQLIHVRPALAEQLAQASRYAVYLDRSIATEDGRRLTQTPGDFQRALAGVSDAHLARAARALTPLAAHLASRGIDGDEVLTGTVFSTCDYNTQMQAIATAVLATQSTPTITIERIYHGKDELDGLLGTPADNTLPGYQPLGIAHSDLAAVVLGTFTSAYFLADTDGQLGRIEFDGGAPIIKSQVQVPFLLTLPAGSLAELPVVVFQHGLGDNRKHALITANSLAAHGMAVIGLELPFHGSRGAELPADSVHEFTGEETPDGIADPQGIRSMTSFFNVLDSDAAVRLDPLIIVDNFRQAAADIIALSRAVDSSDWTPLVDADPAFSALSFDASRLAYTAESFGGFVGVAAVAFGPLYKAAWYNLAGGGLASHLMSYTYAYGPLFQPLIAGTFRASTNDLAGATHAHPVFHMFANLIDGADALTYARTARERGVHTVMACAHGDESIPNQSSEALAAQLGLQWAPVEGSADAPAFIEMASAGAMPTSGNLSIAGERVTGAYFEIEPATHGMFSSVTQERHVQPGYPPIEIIDPALTIASPLRRMHTSMARFARSHHDTGIGVLESGSDIEAP